MQLTADKFNKGNNNRKLYVTILLLKKMGIELRSEGARNRRLYEATRPNFNDGRFTKSYSSTQISALQPAKFFRT